MISISVTRTPEPFFAKEAPVWRTPSSWWLRFKKPFPEFWSSLRHTNCLNPSCPSKPPRSLNSFSTSKRRFHTTSYAERYEMCRMQPADQNHRAIRRVPVQRRSSVLAQPLPRHRRLLGQVPARTHSPRSNLEELPETISKTFTNPQILTAPGSVFSLIPKCTLDILLGVSILKSIGFD